MLDLNLGRKARLFAPTVLLAGLAACSGQGDKPADKTPPAAQSKPAESAKPAEDAAKAAAREQDKAASAQVQSMGTEELHEKATAALRENRMYAPAGDNAVEYYLALRDKQPDDPTVKSALTDLMPYTLIATEQAINHEEFDEAERLIGLIERMDPKAPSLPRLKQSIASAKQAQAQRSREESERLKRQADERAQEQAEQKRLADQAAREAAAAQALAAQQEAARKAEADRAAAAKREADQRAAQQAKQQQAAAKAAAQVPTLRPISTPAPRYPPEALRAGTAGEVIIELTVGTDGSVTNSHIVSAKPARVFDREALNAVKRWKFEPVPSPVTTRRTLAFNPGS